HHPLHLTQSKISDAVDTGLRWAEKAYETDPRARFFFLMWNCLWKSGASIIHGHAQVTMTSDTHYAKVEQWRSAAAFYRHRVGSDYFDDLFGVHQALNLGFEWRGTRVFAYLTPIKEKEIILIAPFITDELRQAIYLALSALSGKMGVTSFNLAIYHPPFGPHDEAWRDFPTIVRIVDRGDPMNKTADMGAMELYASSVISSDPFAVAATLRQQFQ
ncbi:MAG: hypothetical protein KGJ86_21040, partial [Chloroflexota bacterium]|nr:hypothetical protein [Chloroflexota bacterium]